MNRFRQVLVYKILKKFYFSDFAFVHLTCKAAVPWKLKKVIFQQYVVFGILNCNWTSSCNQKLDLFFLLMKNFVIVALLWINGMI